MQSIVEAVRASIRRTSAAFQASASGLAKPGPLKVGNGTEVPMVKGPSIPSPDRISNPGVKDVKKFVKAPPPSTARKLSRRAAARAAPIAVSGQKHPLYTGKRQFDPAESRMAIPAPVSVPAPTSATSPGPTASPPTRSTEATPSFPTSRSDSAASNNSTPITKPTSSTPDTIPSTPWTKILPKLKTEFVYTPEQTSFISDLPIEVRNNICQSAGVTKEIKDSGGRLAWAGDAALEFIVRSMIIDLHGDLKSTDSREAARACVQNATLSRVALGLDLPLHLKCPLYPKDTPDEHSNGDQLEGLIHAMIARAGFEPTRDWVVSLLTPVSDAFRTEVIGAPPRSGSDPSTKTQHKAFYKAASKNWRLGRPRFSDVRFHGATHGPPLDALDGTRAVSRAIERMGRPPAWGLRYGEGRDTYVALAERSLPESAYDPAPYTRPSSWDSDRGQRLSPPEPAVEIHAGNLLRDVQARAVVQSLHLIDGSAQVDHHTGESSELWEATYKRRTFRLVTPKSPAESVEKQLPDVSLQTSAASTKSSGSDELLATSSASSGPTSGASATAPEAILGRDSVPASMGSAPAMAALRELAPAATTKGHDAIAPTKTVREPGPTVGIAKDAPPLGLSSTAAAEKPDETATLESTPVPTASLQHAAIATRDTAQVHPASTVEEPQEVLPPDTNPTLTPKGQEATAILEPAPAATLQASSNVSAPLTQPFFITESPPEMTIHDAPLRVLSVARLPDAAQLERTAILRTCSDKEVATLYGSISPISPKQILASYCDAHKRSYQYLSYTDKNNWEPSSAVLAIAFVQDYGFETGCAGSKSGARDKAANKFLLSGILPFSEGQASLDVLTKLKTQETLGRNTNQFATGLPLTTE